MIQILAAKLAPVVVRPPLEGRLIALGALAVLVGVPAVIVWFLSRIRNRQERRIDASLNLGPGQVRVVFHTYTGFIVYAVQRRYERVMPADDARVLLKKLFWHNLTWGMIAYGIGIVPVLSFFEYRSQSKKIAAAMRGFPVQSKPPVV